MSDKMDSPNYIHENSDESDSSLESLDENIETPDSTSLSLKKIVEGVKFGHTKTHKYPAFDELTLEERKIVTHIGCCVRHLSKLNEGFDKFNENYMIVVADSSKGEFEILSEEPGEVHVWNKRMHERIENCLHFVEKSFNYLNMCKNTNCLVYDSVGDNNGYSEDPQPEMELSESDPQHIMVVVYRRDVILWAKEYFDWSENDFPKLLYQTIKCPNILWTFFGWIAKKKDVNSHIHNFGKTTQPVGLYHLLSSKLDEETKSAACDRAFDLQTRIY